MQFIYCDNNNTEIFEKDQMIIQEIINIQSNEVFGFLIYTELSPNGINPYNSYGYNCIIFKD